MKLQWKDTECRLDSKVFNAIDKKNYDHLQIKYWFNLVDASYIKNDMVTMKTLGLDDEFFRTIC